MFDAAHATLDTLTARVLDELHAHRAAGGNDDEYQVRLVQQFHAAASGKAPTAGVAHMALSLYRLAIASERLEQLAAENARYAATLKDLDSLDGLT